MIQLPFTPSDDAKLLDHENLPVGTYVSFITNGGFAGPKRDHGVIIRKSDKNYIILKNFGDKAQIPFHDDSRRLRAILTAQEYKTISDQNKLENAAKEATRKQKAEDDRIREDAHRIETEARKYAISKLISHHYPEFEGYVNEGKMQAREAKNGSVRTHNH